MIIENNNYPITLSPKLIDAYQSEGFVLTPEVLGKSELDRFGTAVDSEVRRRTALDTRGVGEKSTYEQSFIQCMRLWETDSTIRQLTCHPGLAGLAAQLMGVETVRLWQDQALYKEIGGRVTDAHQDQTFWPVGDVPLITAWIPFDDVASIDGAMAYVPRSQLAGRLKVVDITHTSTPYNILEDPELKGEKPVQVNVSAGSIVWHSGLTVHQAAANDSDKVRRVFTVVYFADGYHRVKKWPIFPLDRAGVKVGELMQGEGLPILWPIPGELPEPPEHQGQSIGPQHSA
ncbi:MAG: phytanoyl-CoA dioxygenase family protein [bacterium]|nr:hypothetical protein [Gammaproteobacteria bacterium]